jgi:hypothetical protein
MAPPEVQGTTQGTPRIVAYGDSIAVGIGNQPGVTRMATGGTGLRNNDLPSRAGIENGDRVIVSVGWNDTSYADNHANEYRARVGDMLVDIQSRNGGAPVVLLGLEEGSAEQGGVYSSGTLIPNRRIRETNDVLRQAAERLGITFVMPNASGERGTDTSDSLHYSPTGYESILRQVQPRLTRTAATATPTLDASREGVRTLRQQTDAAPAPSGTGTIGAMPALLPRDAQERDAARAEELRRQFAGTSEESLQEFFGDLFNNEQLQGNPFATLVLGVIGALLGYDIGANRQAPRRSTATVSDPDGNTHRENGDGAVDTRAPDPTRESNPRFGAGLQVRRETLVSDEDVGQIIARTGMTRENIFKAARRSAVALNTMHPQMRAAVTEQVHAMFLAGHPVVVTECFRSIEEQNRLYAQGRTAPGDIVTHARGGSSFHNYGLAVDIVPVDINGSPVWRTGVNDTSFETIRGFMQHAGVRTIGDWDKPHYEMPISLRELRQLPDRDNDGYRDLPNIPAQWAAANDPAGAGSTAVAAASPTNPPASIVPVSAPAVNESESFAGLRIPTEILGVLNRIDGNDNHKLTQADLNPREASRELIRGGVRDTNSDNIIQLGELNQYLQQFRQSFAGSSRPVLAAV